MVVVTLESTATTNVAHITALKASPLIPDDESGKEEQCVGSKSMLRGHCHTLSPDKILFIRVHEPVAPPPSEAAIHRAEEPSCKRAACELREDIEEPRAVLKKARLIVLAEATVAAAPVRRTVHFELQDNKVRIFERVEACDVANTWWSGQEMLNMMSREKSAVSVMSFCCDHYTSEVLNLMKMARDKNALPGMAISQSGSPVWVANSPARGLERDIVQGFKQRKRQVIRKVLESQRVLKSGRHQVTGERAPPELQTQLLSTQYQKWSHPMVRFAQVLAEGDAQVVIDNASVAFQAC